MRLAATRSDGLAVVTGDSLVPVRDALVSRGLLPAPATMIQLITHYPALAAALVELAEATQPSGLEYRELVAPVQSPSKIWAAASNYLRGSSGLRDGQGRGTAQDRDPDEILELIFLKPPSAVIGPGEAIIIPAGAETIFPELELCAVIGRTASRLSPAEALEAVFGYTIILDVTARGYGSGRNQLATRCVRKGFDTFAPLGPWITTRDEISDPQDVLMQLWVNGELKQSARTDAMINSVAKLVSYLSHVSTLQPGDLIATGNPDAPEFQQQLAPGDTLKAKIEGIGELDLTVSAPGT